MKGKLDKETLKNLKSQAKSLLDQLKDERGMTSQEIADVLNKEMTDILKKKKSKNAIDKWYQGESSPNNNEVQRVIEIFKKLLANPDYLIEEKDNHYGKPPQSDLVWIPFDMAMPVAPYLGINPPLSFISIEEKKGIVTYRNTSKYEADGEFFVGQSGMATDIEPSTRIAIQRINKALWKTDRYYVIMDSSRQITICELLPGDDEKTVRLVSTKNPEGPHRVFPVDEILAIFSIVDGNCIPIPKRKHAVASISQQQDLSPTE
jgi:transcriptional regulator with XRE-family HTH domain